MTYIDISQPLSGCTPAYPGDAPVSLERYKERERDHYTAYLLRTGLHAGTHVDVPMHLTGDPRTVADFPIKSFIGKGVLLDARGEAVLSMKPEYRHAVEEDSIVLLYTGFDAHFHEDAYFTRHPVVGGELAEFLLSKNIKMLGMDLPSPDGPPFSFHKALLERGVFVLENLANLGALSGIPAFEVIALPLRIAAEASPVRAVCRVIE